MDIWAVLALLSVGGLLVFWGVLLGASIAKGPKEKR